MIEKWYADYPDQFKSVWLNENNPKGILIDFPEYKARIIPVGNENPKSLGWYEHSQTKGKFILTEDTTVVSNKNYFQNGELSYTDEDIENDSFKLKKSLQSGSDVNFMGCISSSLEFKVANDFKFLKDQKVTVTLTVTELAEDSINDVVWKNKVFTGYVDEIKRDKSRDLVRQVICNDFLYRIQDDYDVTDWYVWQYGDSEEETTTKHTILELRNTFWDYICNSGTAYDPKGQAIKKKGDGWTQQITTLINDDMQIPKTLNVAPVDFDEYIGGDKIGGPFKRNPKDKSDPSTGTQYDNYSIPSGWNIQDLVARKQVIELGLVGTLFSYNSKTDTNYREYMDDCDTAGTGLGASIKIPREEQEKVRETQITGITVIQAICQFNGVFGQVNGDGEFEYIKLDTTNPIEIEEQYQMDVGYSDIKMMDITGVVIFDKTSEEYSNDQIHTEYGDVKNGKKGSALAYYPDDRTKIEGDNAHVFTIDDNFLMNSYEQKDAITMAQRLYNQISGLSIRNAKLDIKGMPWLTCGQAICYYAPTEETLFPSEDLYPSENLFPSDFQKIVSVIMTYTLSGTGLIKGDIECKAEEITSSIVSLNEVISAEMFSRRIGDNRNFSEFSQTADRIELKVVDEINHVNSSIIQLADDISLRIDGPNGIMSMIELNQEGIQLLGEQITAEAQRIDLIASESIDIKTRLLDIESDNITIKATTVTFEDLATGGKTVINGSSITTGTINCSRIGFGKVTVDGVTKDIDWTKGTFLDITRTSYEMMNLSFVNVFDGASASGTVEIDGTSYPVTVNLSGGKSFYTFTGPDPGDAKCFRSLKFQDVWFLGTSEPIT